jgi:hypothetical protein
MRMVSSGILTTVRITFDKEKRGQATLFSGILINIRIPFDKRNKDKLRCSQNYLTKLSIL